MCLCGLLGFTFLVPVAHAQNSDVLNRLKRIENDVDTLNRAVYKGETPPPSAADNGATADLEVRLGRIENDLRDLTGKVEQQGYDTQQLQQKMDALEQNARMRLDAIDAKLAGGTPMGNVPAMTPTQPNAGGSPTNDPNVIPPTAPDGTPAALQPDANAAASEDVTGGELGSTDAAGLYEQGFAQIKAQDYASAEKTFAAFMKKYPDHALAPNALYWLGETYYVRKDYNKAARTFAEAYQKYPGGPKGADNLLKLGMSLAGKGEKDNACIALGQLRKEYPKGPEPVLKRGEQEMSTLGCGA